MTALQTAATAGQGRLGITIPLPRLALSGLLTHAQNLADAGYTDVWTAEGPGTSDGFTPLAVASAVPRLRLATGVVPVVSRGPATLAQTAASLADLAPGRVVVGIGSSSKFVMEAWNDASFARPYERVRDTLRFLRRALRGEVISHEYGSFRVERFRLSWVPETPPGLMVAALRERMLRLAGREADGAMLTLLSADHAARVSAIVREEGDSAEIVARILIAPTEDPALARAAGRRLLGTYLSIPAYAEFHRWLGSEQALRRSWELWAAGRRAEAALAVPDEIVDALVGFGTPDRWRAHVERYRDNGVDTPVVALLPVEGVDSLDAACALARATG